MRELRAEERVQPHERTAPPRPGEQPLTAAERIDRLEHEVRELDEKLRTLKNDVAGIKTLT